MRNKNLKDRLQLILTLLNRACEDETINHDVWIGRAMGKLEDLRGEL